MSAYPTNDGLAMTYVAVPPDEFPQFRQDPEGCLLRSLDTAGDLGQRVRAGCRVERVYGAADLDNRFRAAHGPGWALVGDAGLAMDPITGQGIADAFRDAELLAGAVFKGLNAGGSLETALHEYQRRRDADTVGMFRFTTDLASLRPLRVQHRLLIDAIQNRPEQIDRLLAAVTGAISPTEYFGPRNLLGVLGVRRMMQFAVMGQRPLA
jgi:flavin-dependent dehydrogenase